MKRLMNRRIYYLLAFFLPLIIVTAADIAMGIHPFGDRAVLIIDSYHQYAPFFSDFYDKIVNGGSLLYSWNGGLGINFWAVAAYYLASPLNALFACAKVISHRSIYFGYYPENSTFRFKLCLLLVSIIENMMCRLCISACFMH